MKPNTNQITLITMHAVKGLEFPIVFIAGMEEGLFPHSRSFISNTALEEERRLCYVGITRAKKLLYLTRAKERTLYSGPQYTIPSRFIADIPSELLLDLNGKNQWANKKQLPKTKITNNNELYNEGDKVIHEKFGKGVIVQAKGEEIAVAFEGFGIKRLLSNIAPLKKVN